MRRTQVAVFEGDAEELIQAVKRDLDSNKRVFDVHWSDDNSSVTAQIRSRLTFGEEIAIQFESVTGGYVRIALSSASGPYWDWGANRRNIENLLDHLVDAGFSGDREPMVNEFRMGS